jgi:hypothetical protein
VHLLQRIHALLQLDVVGGQLSLSWPLSALPVAARRTRQSHLVLDIADLLLDILLRPGSPRCEGSAAKAMSAYLELPPSNTCGSHTGDAAGGHAYDMFFPNAEILPRLSMVIDWGRG